MSPEDVLGVARGASAADVRRAYRRLSFEHHPDRGGDERKLRAVIAAYETIVKRKGKTTRRPAPSEPPRTAPPTPPKKRREDMRVVGYARVGRAAESVELRGIVSRVERQGAGLYNVFTSEDARGMLVAATALFDHAHAWVEYVEESMIRVGTSAPHSKRHDAAFEIVIAA